MLFLLFLLQILPSWSPLWIATISLGFGPLPTDSSSRVPSDKDLSAHQIQFMNKRRSFTGDTDGHSDSDGCPLLLEPTTDVNISGTLYHHDHNNWDRVRRRRSWIHIRCRECEERWKLDVVLCARLSQMCILNINGKKLNADQREEVRENLMTYSSGSTLLTDEACH